MATTEEIINTIQRRLDDRIQKEDRADSLVKQLEESSRTLEELLKDGLEELILQGEYRGSPFCRLHVRDDTETVTYGTVKRTVNLKVFDIDLGDETYKLVPALKTDSTTVTYSVPGRRGLFIICEAQPARTLLAVNENYRELDKAQLTSFINILLNGR